MERMKSEGCGEGPPRQDRARLVGEIVSDAIAQLGERRAMMPDAQVAFGPTAGRGEAVGPAARVAARGNQDGSPRNTASVWGQIDRPHSAHAALRPKYPLHTATPPPPP